MILPANDKDKIARQYMSDKCEHLRNFMKCQLEVIQRHIDEHKWLNQIPEADKGVSDFIAKYGWLMREMYCVYTCPKKDECTLPKVTLETNKKQKKKLT